MFHINNQLQDMNLPKSLIKGKICFMNSILNNLKAHETNEFY